MIEAAVGETALIGSVVSNLATSGVTAAAIMAIWYLTHKAQNAEREADRKTRAEKEIAEREERKRQADEHMVKWNSMLEQHEAETARLVAQNQGELDRAYRLHEREVQVNELHANLLQSLISDVKNNQFCPVVRDNTHPKT